MSSPHQAAVVALCATGYLREGQPLHWMKTEELLELLIKQQGVKDFIRAYNEHREQLMHIANKAELQYSPRSKELAMFDAKLEFSAQHYLHHEQCLIALCKLVTRDRPFCDLCNILGITSM